MAFKFVLALAFVAAASAGYAPVQQVYQAAPVAHTVAVAQPVLAKNVEEYDPHPQYKYAYDVQDSITGDSKSQVETRDGDVVRGEYSLIDADGYKRIVQYTADDVHGFNAVVTRVPVGAAIKTVAAAPVAYSAPAVVKTVAPVAYAAAPAYYKSAPVAYAAPAVVKTVAAAPVAYAAAPAYYKSAPATYAAPAVVKTVAAAPVAYAAAPAYYKSAPATYAAPAVVKTVAAAPVAYAAAPAYYKSAPATYAVPAVVKTAHPVSYSAPAYYNSAPVTYASQAVVKAPLGYAAHSAYAAAPAVAYGHH